jgi:hypothetical protein
MATKEFVKRRLKLGMSNLQYNISLLLKNADENSIWKSILIVMLACKNFATQECNIFYYKDM